MMRAMSSSRGFGSRLAASGIGMCFMILTVTLGLMAGAARPAAALGVTVAVTPTSQTVPLGGEFDLVLQVPVAGSEFNGFDAQVSYDPAALTLVPASPTLLQVGTLMSDACGNLFHHFNPGVGVDSIAVVLLCAATSVTGPGPLYKLHFKAASTAQVTHVRIVPGSLKFYSDGLFVLPVVSTDAVIGIGTPVTAVDPALAHGVLRLSASPNPGHGSVLFTASRAGTGPESLTVRDVQGRTVRALRVTGEQVAWDGRRETGEPVPDGIYFATLTAEGRTLTIRVSLLH